MQFSEREKGTSLVLLKRLVNERLPRLLEIKKAVERGDPLGESDIKYLDQAMQDAFRNRHYATLFPQYAEMAGKIAQLYTQITSKALENELARKEEKK